VRWGHDHRGSYVRYAAKASACKDLKQGGIHEFMVCGSPTNSGTTVRLKGSRNRLSLRTRRWNEQGWRPTIFGKRWPKKRATEDRSRKKKEREDSTPRSCWKMARVMTSESESFLREA
jgi:hypothetical protein